MTIREVVPEPAPDPNLAARERIHESKAEQSRMEALKEMASRMGFTLVASGMAQPPPPAPAARPGGSIVAWLGFSIAVGGFLLPALDRFTGFGASSASVAASIQQIQGATAEQRERLNLLSNRIEAASNAITELRAEARGDRALDAADAARVREQFDRMTIRLREFEAELRRLNFYVSPQGGRPQPQGEPSRWIPEETDVVTASNWNALPAE